MRQLRRVAGLLSCLHDAGCGGAYDLGDHFSNWCAYQVIRAPARSVLNAAPPQKQD
jgi:hypothetical protein